MSIMITPWENKLISLSAPLPIAWVQFPASVEAFKDLSLPAGNTPPTRPEPAWQLNLPSMAPHNLWAARRKTKTQSWTDTDN